MTEPSWLWRELERAAQDYAAIPEYLRPVLTVGNPTDRPLGWAPAGPQV